MKHIALAGTLLVSLAAPAWAGFDDGLLAYVRGDYGNALREWKPLAEQGDSGAQFGLVGWLWDDDPQDCYKSKSTRCKNQACLGALLVSCKYKFSSDKFTKWTGQCIFGHLKLIRNKWSVKAVMDGCTITSKAKNSFYMDFGACVAGRADQIYDADTYRIERRFCWEVIKYMMKLFPETE